jgi:hypothetical protein
MKANQKASLGDETKQHLFLAKYLLGVLLIKGDVTMIVTEVTFILERAEHLVIDRNCGKATHIS